MGIAEHGPARLARLPHVNNVKAHMAAIRNITIAHVTEVCVQR
jgi:hypothetical protein